jgi:hypothetical protein
MKTKISNHIIEYHWDDSLERTLSGNSKDIIVQAINKNYVRGKLRQDGIWCQWQDVTDDDILMFGMTQKWFK